MSLLIFKRSRELIENLNKSTNLLTKFKMKTKNHYDKRIINDN